MDIIWDHLKQKMHEAREQMNDIKGYRNNELKNYVIGNILVGLYFSSVFSKVFLEDIKSNINILSIIIESTLSSSIIYIYIDSIIPGDVKQNILCFHIRKLPRCRIFTKIKQGVNDARFIRVDVMKNIIKYILIIMVS